MLPLPMGTVKLCHMPWLGTTLTAAYPSRTMWTWNMGWAGEVVSIGELDCEVYHVPQPAPADKPDPLDQLAEARSAAANLAHALYRSGNMPQDIISDTFITLIADHLLRYKGNR